MTMKTLPAFATPGVTLVRGSGRHPERAPVVAAIDDDTNPGPVLRYAAAAAHRLGVPLRVVHVWTGRDTPRGPRTNRYDRMGDADRLLSTVLYDHLTQDEAERAEREILHDRDAGHALVVLSSQSSLMVVAARTDRTGDGPFGETARALIGRTACPLAVLPCCDEDISAYPGW
jgi:nucleotide-binding universal stress UspA family protein